MTTSKRRSPGVLFLLVAAYIVLLPYQFEVERQLHLAPSDSFLFLALALAAGHWRYRKPAWTIWHLAIAMTFVVGTFIIAQRIGHIERYELLNKDVGLMLPFLSYAAITSAVVSWTDLRLILKVFVLGVVGENILAVAGFLASYFFGFANPFARYEGLRLSGMLLDPNAYGSLLVAALVLCEAASWGRLPLFRGFTLWFSRVTLLLGILFTFSRTAWTGLGVALLLAGLIRPRVLLRPLLAALIGGPLLLLIMGHRFVPLFQRMARRPEQVQERFDLAHRALESFARHPFFGGGIGSFRLAAGVVAHNSAMWFLADFGLAGLTALMGFLGWFFVKAWLAYRRAPESQQPVVLSLLLSLAAMVGVAMGIEAFYQRHFWMIFALIASSYCLTLHPESAQDAAASSPSPSFRRARSLKDLRHRESEVLAHAY